MELRQCFIGGMGIPFFESFLGQALIWGHILTVSKGAFWNKGGRIDTKGYKA
jgi:hypothetical protein